MADAPVVVERRDGGVLVRLHRPDKHNAALHAIGRRRIHGRRPAISRA